MKQRKTKKYFESMVGNFVYTGVELIHIKNITSVNSIYHFKYLKSSYSEVELEGSMTIYHLDNNNFVEKNTTSKIFLTVDTSKIISASRQNIASLLLDSSTLIKNAAHDLISCSY